MTAQIKVTGHGERFKPLIRCFGCETNYVFYRLLEKHKFLGKAKDHICSGKDCFQPAFRQSRLRKDHLLACRGSPMEFANCTGYQFRQGIPTDRSSDFWILSSIRV
ncbi:hypothetical protein ACQKWADRAFT_279024 [Trichoderma austrokoningii]